MAPKREKECLVFGRCNTCSHQAGRTHVAGLQALQRYVWLPGSVVSFRKATKEQANKQVKDSSSSFALGFKVEQLEMDLDNKVGPLDHVN